LSSAARVEAPQPSAKSTNRRKKVGRTRKLDKRIESKPDGRYIVYYKPA
jgi:hypothetical protein